jgi:CDP-glucose 4,6-dehydratase
VILEAAHDLHKFYAGTRVFVTGHTGFKGSWLSLWLRHLGARVYGYALEPPTEPSLYQLARIADVLESDARSNLSDPERIGRALDEAQPGVIFHLAAQPLVRASYSDPLETWATNLMGTANVLEAARFTPSVRVIVIITTDKVYENREWPYPYRENDPLGGHDPYSASKAAAEIMTASYRACFFKKAERTETRVATARAGNVIGGGDWASDRLLPDCIRAFNAGIPVRLRNPDAVRPWQHVLDPLAGYLALAMRLAGTEGPQFAKAWNFGPDASSDATVGQIAEATARLWGGCARVEYLANGENLHEAGVLRLDSTQARTELDWKPSWSLEQALERTASWYKAWNRKEEMSAFTLGQIRSYEAGE